jgi:hypothetical protein
MTVESAFALASARAKPVRLEHAATAVEFASWHWDRPTLNATEDAMIEAIDKARLAGGSVGCIISRACLHPMGGYETIDGRMRRR